METLESKQVRRVRVADVMSTPPVTIDATASLWDAVERFFLSGLRHLVVVANGRCVGVIDDRQVAAQWPERAINLRSRRVGDILDGRQSYTVADARVVDAARVMLSRRLDALPVVDDEQRVVGIITGSDLIQLLVAGDEAEFPAR